MMEFRADFVVAAIHLFIFSFFNIAFYRAVLANTGNIAGWNYPQMIVLVGTYIFIDSLFFTFLLGNFGHFDQLIRRAELDRVLTKPIDAQFVCTLQKVNYKELASFFMGIFIICYGLVQASFTPNAMQVIGFLFFCLVSFSVMYSLSLILGCIAFYSEKAEDLHEVIISLWQFAKLPDVYRGIVKAIFMMFVPIVFASFVPAGIFFGKVNPWFLVYYLAIAIFLFYISRKIWKISLRRYKSSGG
jgi:ABC-2 type transport system permease protein